MKFIFDASKNPRCENKAIIYQKYFFVNRITPPRPSTWHDITFVAKLKDTDLTNMATLEASSKGYCNWVSTILRYRMCGLSKALMKVCFTDDKITANGGFKLLTDNKWKDNNKKIKVNEVCKTMIFLQCKPDDTDDQGTCIGYIKSAFESKFDMLFTEKKDEENYKAIKLEDAIVEFAIGPQAFITKYGDTWFFCDCKPSKKSECHALQ
jgi:hypothetical protein